jgi:anthranilate phosphoribosyltransferase
MKETLRKLFEKETLSTQEAKKVLLKITEGAFNHAQIASFLTVFLMRKITVAELTGFKDAMLEKAIRIDLSEYELIDLCGTGGDGKNTFNISTLTAFVVAGAGKKVAKHGNVGVSSVSGSSNLLSFLGLEFTNHPSVLLRQLDRANICFLHAPLFHPAMKTLAPVRKELGLRTFLNLLGPLVNPSQPNLQMVGVYHPEIALLYNEVLKNNRLNYTIVHSTDGYDEISLTAPFLALGKNYQKTIEPSDLKMSQVLQNELFGGDSVAESAKIFSEIISGNGTNAQNNVVCVNAAFALKTIDESKSFEEAFEEAQSSLLGLKAKKSLDILLTI